MKKWMLALILVAASAAVAHGIYFALCPKVAEDRCKMQWLRAQLELSPEQFTRIEAIHKARWPALKQLQKEKQCGKMAQDGSVMICERATKELIDAVCAELTQQQKAKYLSLVAPCSRKDRGCSNGNTP